MKEVCPLLVKGGLADIAEIVTVERSFEVFVLTEREWGRNKMTRVDFPSSSVV